MRGIFYVIYNVIYALFFVFAKNVTVVISNLVFIRFGAVACGIGQELYVFGGVRNRDSDNPESSQMTICKSEFFHDELKR